MYQKFLHEREVGKEVNWGQEELHTCRNQARQQLLHVFATQHIMRQELTFFGRISDFLQEQKSLHRNIINQVIIFLTTQSNLLKFLGNFNCRLWREWPQNWSVLLSPAKPGLENNPFQCPKQNKDRTISSLSGIRESAKPSRSTESKLHWIFKIYYCSKWRQAQEGNTTHYFWLLQNGTAVSQLAFLV